MLTVIVYIDQVAMKMRVGEKGCVYVPSIGMITRDPRGFDSDGKTTIKVDIALPLTPPIILGKQNKRLNVS